MKKITLLFIFLFLTAELAFSQVPTYSNSNTGGTGNSFPLNALTAASRQVQWCIPPNSLGAVSQGNNITDVYFQCGSGATKTYPTVIIRLKQGSPTGLTAIAGGPIEAGMTTVYTGLNTTVVGVTNGWIRFTLNTPFLYDPSLPLYVALEQDSPTFSGGPTVLQDNFTYAGNGRQWSDIGATTNASGVAASLIHFGIDVIPATPCTTTPFSNGIVPTTTLVCPLYGQTNFSMSTTYSLGGLTYSWQTSNNAVGGFTSIPTASMNTLLTPTLNADTYFRVVVTCTNPGGGTMTSAPVQIKTATVVTNTVPYNESFEDVVANNDLPNCSWTRSNINTTQTYTVANTLSRIPRTGSKFASFVNSPAGVNYYWSNGIYLNAGVTYSAALWYITEYFGYNNWTDLSILYGTTQSTTGLVSIVSSNVPVVSNVYKSLSNTFQVATSGLYYFAVKGTGAAGSAQYLTWDDFSITIPCRNTAPNTPTLSLLANTLTICSGDPVNLSVSGADTYTWSNGSNSSSISEFPGVPTTYTVSGTNNLSGCTSTLTQAIQVNASPLILAASNISSVCLGSQAALQALGGVTYAWSNGAFTPAINVAPTTATTYSVIGTGPNGCGNTAVITIGVHALPNVTASSNMPNNMCTGETALLTAAGNSSSYQWVSSSSSVLWSGSPISVSPNVTSIYTVTGTDANGCMNKTTVSQNVSACTGLNEAAAVNSLKLYPNPTNGELNIESNTTLAKVIEVVDLNGKVVSITRTSEQTAKINISALAKGVYYVKIQSNNALEVIKVIKD